MKYDEILCRKHDGYAVEYGTAWGGPVVVFIKAGRGGNCFGFDNKYLKMAHLLRERRNCSVVCAANPADVPATYAEDAEFLQERFSTATEVYAVGSSNGAFQVLELAKRYPAVQKLLLINLPLMINYHKIKASLCTLSASERRIFGVWGGRDPSAPYVRFVQNLALPNCHVETVANADHCFTDMTERFIELPERLFS